ncbi:hypothetical protein [Flagellimonas sp.]|uniref:hypothetical protein n=1 Tax=Flagellimonas sp. TaxID=2058762 RepID=UPI003BAE9E8A
MANDGTDDLIGAGEAFFIRVTIEGFSFGMGSMVRQVGGDRVAEEVTNTVLSRTGEGVQKAVTDENKKKQGK